MAPAAPAAGHDHGRIATHTAALTAVVATAAACAFRTARQPPRRQPAWRQPPRRQPPLGGSLRSAAASSAAASSVAASSAAAASPLPPLRSPGCSPQPRCMPHSAAAASRCLARQRPLLMALRHRPQQPRRSRHARQRRPGDSAAFVANAAPTPHRRSFARRNGAEAPRRSQPTPRLPPSSADAAAPRSSLDATAWRLAARWR